jgi:hypothetical protein
MATDQISNFGNIFIFTFFPQFIIILAIALVLACLVSTTSLVSTAGVVSAARLVSTAQRRLRK